MHFLDLHALFARALGNSEHAEAIAKHIADLESRIAVLEAAAAHTHAAPATEEPPVENDNTTAPTGPAI